MLKIGQNWGKIVNYPPNAQQRFALLHLACHDSPRLLASVNNSYGIKIGRICDCDL